VTILFCVGQASFKYGCRATEPGYWEQRDSRTHKVSLDYYRRESANVYAKFKEYVRNGQVGTLPNLDWQAYAANQTLERASIDEVFIDLSIMIRERILERYSYLREVPPDAPKGSNSALPPPPQIQWTDDLGHLPEGEPDISGLQNTMEHDPSTTWHDVALSIGAEIVKDIRLGIHRDVGYTTSAGIARNKV
jgi:DNA polymerase eta